MNGIAFENPLRYRGYYYDSDTGLYYLQSRYYDSNTGRFINSDEPEILLNNVVNVFSYCGNNPVMYIDPNGYYNITKFNCYAYAMGIFDKWMHPGKGVVNVLNNYGYLKDPRYLMPYSYSVDDVVNWVIKDFGKNVVRKINGKNAKLKKGEYRIAIRIYGFIGPVLSGKIPTYDFHFWKQDPKTGKWWHKPGKNKIDCLGKVNADKSKKWGFYNSSTKYLAVKRKFIKK